MNKLKLLLFVPFLLSCEPKNDPTQENWVSLFNGTDLNDWQIKIAGYELNDNYANTFRVEDSVIKVSYHEYDSFSNQFGLIFYKEPFSNYRLKVTYRFLGDQAPGGPGWAWRNSGILFHSQSPESMLKDQNFPISLEYQFLGGDGENNRTTGNLCTPGTHVMMNNELITQHCVSSTSKTYHGDQWVEAELLVLEDSVIQHIMDNQVVIEYSRPVFGMGNVSNFDSLEMKEGQPLKGGYISLQSESHPIEFKEVLLLNLEGCMDKKAKNYKSYYLKADNSTCIY